MRMCEWRMCALVSGYTRPASFWVTVLGAVDHPTQPTQPEHAVVVCTDCLPALIGSRGTLVAGVLEQQ